jgi:hypothetical protein
MTGAAAVGRGQTSAETCGVHGVLLLAHRRVITGCLVWAYCGKLAQAETLGLGTGDDSAVDPDASSKPSLIRPRSHFVSRLGTRALAAP